MFSDELAGLFHAAVWEAWKHIAGPLLFFVGLIGMQAFQLEPALVT